MTAIPKRNDIISRIERLERLVSDLTRPNLNAPIVDDIGEQSPPLEESPGLMFEEEENLSW